MAEYVSRDPFARTTTMRERSDGECAWCGGTDSKGKVYTYYTEPDSGRPARIMFKHKFCSMSCVKSYFNFE